MIYLDVIDPADPTTVLATLDQPYDIGWIEDLVDAGGGDFRIPHDSPVVQSNPGLLRRGRLIRVRRGSDPVGLWEINGGSRIQGDVWDAVHLQGESARYLTRYGLVEGEYGMTQCVPSDERTWNFASKGLDRSGWGVPVSLGTVASPTPLLPKLAGQPEGWPDRRAEWIWTVPLTQSEGRVFHPEGVSYFVRPLRAGISDFKGVHRLFIAGTNRWELWFDGVNLGSGGGFRDIATFDIPFFARDTILGVRVEKDDHPWWTWDPGLLLLSIVQIVDGEEVGGAHYRTYTPEVTEGDPSPDPWMSLHNPPSPPGFTAGQILEEVFDEGQARGVWPGWTRSFSRDTDTSGKAWSETMEFVAQIGADSLWTVAQRLQEAAGTDIEVTPQLRFDAYQTRGVDRGLTPDVGVSTVTFPVDELAEVEVQNGGEDRFNAALVRTRDSWMRVPDPGPSSDRREAFLSFGLAPSAAGARGYAQKVVVEWRDDRPLYTFACPDTYDPGAHEVGDVVAAPVLPMSGGDLDLFGEWTLADVRIMTITHQVVDVSGQPTVRVYEVVPV